MGISGELRQIRDINAYVGQVTGNPNKTASEQAVDLAPVGALREIISTAITNEKSYQQNMSSGFMSILRKIAQG
jgi:hypothetical protein